MKYETPEITTLAAAIDVTNGLLVKEFHHIFDGIIPTTPNESFSVYEDWE